MDMFVGDEVAVDEREFLPDPLRQIRVQFEPALLGVEEYAHQLARLIAKNTARRRVDESVQDLKTIDDRFAGSGTFAP